MIQRLSLASVYVLDQDSAKAFYTEKLGFELRADLKLGSDLNDIDGPGEGFRWLTVGPPGQPDVEITLMAIRPGGMWDAETAQALRKLVEKGTFGFGAFQTDDCQRTYEELTARGVVFKSPPTERPYGIEAVFADDSNNWFSLLQKR